MSHLLHFEPSSMCEIDGQLYYFQKHYCAFMKVDLEKKEHILISTFVDENISDIKKIIPYNKKILLFPADKKYFIEYSIEESNFLRVDILDEDNAYGNDFNILLYGDEILYISLSGKLIRFDCKKNKTAEEINLMDEVKKRNIKCDYLTYSCLDENKLILNLFDQNALLFYDLEKKTSVLKTLEDLKDKQYASFTILNHHIFWYDKKNSVIDKFDYDLSHEKSYTLDKKLYRIVGTEREIIADCLKEDKVLCFDDGLNVKCKIENSNNLIVNDNELIIGFTEFNNKFYYNCGDNTLRDINNGFQTMLFFEVENSWGIKNTKIIRKEILHESRTESLESFIMEI